MATKLRGFGMRDKLKSSDLLDLASDAASGVVGGTAPGAAGYAPSPHSLSSAHHTGELGNLQAPQFAYIEGSGTDRPAYNANRMTGALAHVVPNVTDTYDLGTSSKWWRQQYVSQINGAVFAENVIQLLGGWFIVGHAQGTLQMPTAYLQVETATVLGSITAGVAQVETATVTGTATAGGNMTVVVTAAGMTGSPVSTTVPFDSGTTASQMATLVRSYLSFAAGIMAWFTIGGSGANVALTRKSTAANDATMNIAISGASAQGFPDSATSANTTAGVASGAGNATVIVTAAGMVGTPKTVSVAVADSDTATLVAGKIRTALAADADVGAFFTVSGSGANVVLTSVAYTASNDATMNISIDNGTCTGLTAAPTSTNTTAGGTRTDIDFGAALSVNDFILIKGHDVTGTIKTEYMQVTALVSGTTYTVTRDLAAAHATDPVWAEGTPWLNLGYTGDGRIEFDAYDTPRMQMFTQGSTYNAQTEVLRVGDLNAGWGYVAETYGVAMGDYAASKANICVEPTNGLRMRSYATTKLQLQPDGDVFIGSDISSVASTQLCIFTNAQTYNAESVEAGDILIGDSSNDKANVFWDQSAGNLNFRTGKTVLTQVLGSGELWVKSRFTVGDLAAGSRQALEIAASSADIYIGSASQDGNVYVRNMAGTAQVSLNGANGDITAKGGINVGTATGAGTGQIKVTGSVRSIQISGDGSINATLPGIRLTSTLVGGEDFSWVIGTIGLALYDEGAAAYRIMIKGAGETGAGNIGFGGNTNPAEVLDVTGNIKASGSITGAALVGTSLSVGSGAISGGATSGSTGAFTGAFTIGTGTRKALEIDPANADLYVGSDSQAGDIHVRNTAGTANISLNGTNGDITAKSGINVGSATSAATGQVRCSDRIQTADGHLWDLGTWVASGITPTGYIYVKIDGTTYRLAAVPV